MSRDEAQECSEGIVVHSVEEYERLKATGSASPAETGKSDGKTDSE